jgi:hypothetical protein
MASLSKHSEWSFANVPAAFGHYPAQCTREAFVRWNGHWSMYHCADSLLPKIFRQRCFGCANFVTGPRCGPPYNYGLLLSSTVVLLRHRPAYWPCFPQATHMPHLPHLRHAPAFDWRCSIGPLFLPRPPAGPYRTVDRLDLLSWELRQCLALCTLPRSVTELLTERLIHGYTASVVPCPLDLPFSSVGSCRRCPPRAVPQDLPVALQGSALGRQLWAEHCLPFALHGGRHSNATLQLAGPEQGLRSALRRLLSRRMRFGGLCGTAPFSWTGI